MSLLTILELVMMGLGILVERTQGQLDDEVVGYLRAALENVKKAHAQELTRQRLMEWRVEPRW